MDKLEKERLLKFARHISLSTKGNLPPDYTEFETLILKSLDGTDIVLWQMKIPGWLMDEMVLCFDDWIVTESGEQKWRESEPEENAFTSMLDFFGIQEIESFEAVFSNDFTLDDIAKNILGYIARKETIIS